MQPSISFERRCGRTSGAFVTLPFPTVEAALTVAARKLTLGPLNLSGFTARVTAANASLVGEAVALELSIEVDGVRRPRTLSITSASSGGGGLFDTTPPVLQDAHPGGGGAASTSTLLASLAAPTCSLSIDGGIPHLALSPLVVKSARLKDNGSGHSGSSSSSSGQAPGLPTGQQQPSQPPPHPSPTHWAHFIDSLDLPAHLSSHFRHELSSLSGVALLERMRGAPAVAADTRGRIRSRAARARYLASLEALDPWSATGRLVVKNGEASSASPSSPPPLRAAAPPAPARSPRLPPGRRAWLGLAGASGSSGGLGSADPFSPRRRLLADASAGGSFEDVPLASTPAAAGSGRYGGRGHRPGAGEEEAGEAAPLLSSNEHHAAAATRESDLEAGRGAPPHPSSRGIGGGGGIALEVTYTAWPPWSNPSGLQVAVLLSALLLGVPLLVLGGVAIMSSIFHWRV